MPNILSVSSENVFKYPLSLNGPFKHEKTVETFNVILNALITFFNV